MILRFFVSKSSSPFIAISSNTAVLLSITSYTLALTSFSNISGSIFLIASKDSTLTSLPTSRGNSIIPSASCTILDGRLDTTSRCAITNSSIVSLGRSLASSRIAASELTRILPSSFSTTARLFSSSACITRIFSGRASNFSYALDSIKSKC